MTARLLLLFAMFFGIAVAPVKPVVRCAVAKVATCERCCPAVGRSCCAASSAPAQPAPPVGTTASDEGKQLVAPTLFFLCLSPTPATEVPAVQRQHAARLPALPLRDLICVRLV